MHAAVLSLCFVPLAPLTALRLGRNHLSTGAGYAAKRVRLRNLTRAPNNEGPASDCQKLDWKRLPLVRAPEKLQSMVFQKLFVG